MTLSIRAFGLVVGVVVSACANTEVESSQAPVAVTSAALHSAWDTQLQRPGVVDGGPFSHGSRLNSKKPSTVAKAMKHHGSAPRSCTATARLTPKEVAQFASQVEPLRIAFQVPGTAVALVECGRIVYQAGFGLRELETKRPVTPDTVFRVGSTTKAMTSSLLATWVDEGRFEFSTRAVDVDPTFQLPSDELTNSVTIGQLMGMGTGLEEPPPYWWELRTAADLMQLLPSAPIVTEPGIYHYNNHVYASAGYVGLIGAGISPPTIRGFAHAMESRVFRPIGMHPAAISDDPATVSHDHAHSYGLSVAHGLDYATPLPLFQIGALAPAGSVATNVTSMARFVIMQLNAGVAPNGTRVVSARNLSRTHAAQTPMPGGTSANAGYAMGWVAEDNAGVKTLWHNGSIDAFGTLMWTVPDDHLGLVVLANGFFSGDFYVALQESLMRQLYGASNVDPGDIIAGHATVTTALSNLADTLLQQPPVDPARVQPFLGRYAHQIELSLDPEHGDLLFTAPGMRTVLASVEEIVGAPSTYVFADGGSFFLQPVRLAQGATTLQLELLDQGTLEPIATIEKMP